MNLLAVTVAATNRCVGNTPVFFATSRVRLKKTQISRHSTLSKALKWRQEKAQVLQKFARHNYFIGWNASGMAPETRVVIGKVAQEPGGSSKRSNGQQSVPAVQHGRSASSNCIHWLLEQPSSPEKREIADAFTKEYSATDRADGLFPSSKLTESSSSPPDKHCSSRKLPVLHRALTRALAEKNITVGAAWLQREVSTHYYSSTDPRVRKKVATIGGWQGRTILLQAAAAPFALSASIQRAQTQSMVP